MFRIFKANAEEKNSPFDAQKLLKEIQSEINHHRYYCHAATILSLVLATGAFAGTGFLILYTKDELNNSSNKTAQAAAPYVPPIMTVLLTAGEIYGFFRLAKYGIDAANAIKLMKKPITFLSAKLYEKNSEFLKNTLQYTEEQIKNTNLFELEVLLENEIAKNNLENRKVAMV